MSHLILCKRILFKPTSFILYHANNCISVTPTHFPSTFSRYQWAPTQIRAESNFNADLGIRSALPPDSTPEPSYNKAKDISDQEWEIRTGRAIYILTQSLPEFFSTGLIEKPTKLETNSNVLHTSGPSDTGVDSIYSSQIRLTYTPPVALPAPFLQTLRLEGLPLYMASSVFVRHTLNALYADLHVELRKVNVHTSSSGPSSAWQLADGDIGSDARKGIVRREKSLFIGLCVQGTARVSGGVGQWEVNSTYTFSPQTGLIYMHRIDSIHPSPHQAVYDVLRASFVNVFGLGDRKPTGARGCL